MLYRAKQYIGKLLGTETATRLSDPSFYNALTFLPNPDSVLRKLGKSQEVYDAIVQDAHVIGELRPMRTNIIAKKWHILPGGDKPEDIRAFRLAQKVYGRPPVPALANSPGMGWPDVFWNMQTAVLRGQSIHEVVWGIEDGLQVPQMIIGRPNHRFVYGTLNELRLLTREYRVSGVPVDNYKFLVSRHMPDYDNPYGIALLSACFWPYVFKHNGFRFFAKFCDKYGIPWAIGKYPSGTAQKEIDALADGLVRMVEDAIAAIPNSGSVQLVGGAMAAISDGSSVQLVEAGASANQTPQERLIHICNAEISKCLSSQTLATEIKGQASHAAAKVHRGREQENGAADRKLVEGTNNLLLSWLTELNFTGAAPPLFQFYDGAQVRKEWMEVFSVANKFMDIPTQFAHERLQIPQAVNGEAVIISGSNGALGSSDFALPTAKHLEQWIEIFRAGSITDSQGQGHQFTANDLDEVVANFKPDSPPPYVIGHPKDNAPVLGRVRALKRVGLGLWAKGTQIDPEFDKLIEKGFYRNRSVRIIQSPKGWQLVHVGFLGATPPAVKGLAPINIKNQ